MRHMTIGKVCLFTLVGALFGCDAGGGGNDIAINAGGAGGKASSGGSSGSGGGPSCAGGQMACAGQCIDVTTDTANCGVCGKVCGATDQCCSGQCVETASCAFSVTGLTPLNGMQSGGEWVTVKGAGFVAGMRIFVGEGRAPTRVTSPTTALIQTPPGPAGNHDVKIVLGTSTATLKQAFKYLSAGLLTPWKEVPMQVVRGENPGIAVLQDGRVLIAGGTIVPDLPGDSVDTAELFIRSSETMVPANGTMAGAASVPRWQNNAVTLLTGKALVVGGACYNDLTKCTGDPKVAHLYDPATDTFAPTATPMSIGRAYTRSVLLPDGRVFISSSNDSSIEIYDPDTDSFTQVAHTQRHTFGFVVRLRDGRVLLGAGDGGVTAAEVFDPDTNTLTSVAPLAAGRSMLTAHTLPDGRVMVIGGASSSAGGITAPIDSIELFDPKTNKFSTAPYKLSIGRCWHASALVRDGSVLVMGGYTITGQCGSSVGSVDQVNPIAGTVTPFDALPNGKAATEWNAVTLLDGSIVAVGGGACGTSKALPEVYFLPGAPLPQ